MYIRSQDKTKLFKLDYLHYGLVNNYHCLLVDDISVGTYDSKEAAMIQLETVTALLYNKDKRIYELE
jgi:hypothetical protein